MNRKSIFVSAGAGICSVAGALAVLQGCMGLGIPLILIGILNMWILFRPVKEVVRVLIVSTGVGVSFGVGIYSDFIGQKLFGLVVIAIGLANFIILIREASPYEQEK